MKAEEFDELRRKQKLRLADIAWMTGTTLRQVARWTKGDTPVPLTAELLLKAFAQDKIDAHWLVKNIKAPIP